MIAHSANPPVAAHEGRRYAIARNALRAMEFASLLFALTGCTGGGVVHSIPLGTKRISTASPLIETHRPQECYYWLDDRSRLCVTMRHKHASIFGKILSEDRSTSLVFDGAPAGDARSYPVDRRTLRMRIDQGFTHLRGASLSGAAAIWDYCPGKPLHGRFRITATQQSFSILTGWSGDARVLLASDFMAVPNEAAGMPILTETEEGALRRDPLSTAP